MSPCDIFLYFFSVYVKLFPSYPFGLKLYRHNGKALPWCLHGIHITCLFTFNLILSFCGATLTTVCNAARLIKLKFFIRKPKQHNCKASVVFLSTEYCNLGKFVGKMRFTVGLRGQYFQTVFYITRGLHNHNVHTPSDVTNCAFLVTTSLVSRIAPYLYKCQLCCGMYCKWEHYSCCLGFRKHCVREHIE